MTPYLLFFHETIESFTILGWKRNLLLRNHIDVYRTNERYYFLNHSPKHAILLRFLVWIDQFKEDIRYVQASFEKSLQEWIKSRRASKFGQTFQIFLTHVESMFSQIFRKGIAGSFIQGSINETLIYDLPKIRLK